MSAAVNSTGIDTVAKIGSDGALEVEKPAKKAGNKTYKGFVAGVFSGIAKLSGKLNVALCPKLDSC